MLLPEVCVLYLVRDDGRTPPAVLLGRKKTGLGVGKLVGLGGKLELGESAEAAAAREALEESGLVVEPAALRAAGVIDYMFPSRPSWSQRSHVFVGTLWRGDPIETDELAPSWFERERIPYEAMWDDARLWLPEVLAGGSVSATFTFGPDLNSVIAASH